MATNKTEHYGLNQWVKSDEVLMEDFNEDNAKIEAAFQQVEIDLAALDSRKLEWEPIKTVICEEATAQFDFDVSDIDWGAYRYVLMECSVPVSGSGTMYLIGNGTRSFGSFWTLGSANSSEGLAYLEYRKKFQVLFFPFRDVNRSVSCICLAYLFTYGTSGSDKNYSTLSTLGLMAYGSSYPISAGTQLDFYGMR